MKYGKTNGVQLIDVNDFEAVIGKGVIGIISGKQIALGNRKLMEKVGALINDDLETKITMEQQLGKTVSYISIDKTTVGYVAISDAIKESSKRAITELIDKGIEVIMMHFIKIHFKHTKQPHPPLNFLHIHLILSPPRPHPYPTPVTL